MTSRIDSRKLASLVLFVALLAATTWVAHARQGGVRHRPAPPPVAGDAARIEVAFVLDTTGSMSGLIEGAKRKIWSIADRMASGQPRPEIRMGLIGYRDRGDTYVTRFHDLSDDVDGIYGHLQALQAGGGGDTPESVNRALHEAVARMDWSTDPNVYRVIFLVGDAPPHADYANDVPWAESVAEARRRGIAVNTIQCGTLASTTPIWEAIASRGGGLYAAIRQDGGMVAVHTPMDEELASLGRALADTVVPYGDVEERTELETKRLRALKAPAPAAASRLAYLHKTGGRANSGRSDLVDAVKEGRVDAAELDEDALPEALVDMEPGERQAFVKQKAEARDAIQRRIGALAAERERYLRAEEKRRAEAGQGDGFDQRVFEAIREQAAGKGITY